MLYDELALSVGRCIKAARLQKGYTQEELGNLIGVTKATINRYENGNIKKINPENLQPLADALGISVFELIPAKHLSDNAFAERYTKIATAKSLVAELYGNDVVALLNNAIKLTAEGVGKLNERALELLEIPRYNQAATEALTDSQIHSYPEC